MKTALCAAAIALLSAAPASAGVAITEGFTITVGPPAVTLSPGLNLFNSNDVPAFNTADGTLTSVDVSLAGFATWTSSFSIPTLFANLVVVLPSPPTVFTNTGSIFLSLSDTSSDPIVLQHFESPHLSADVQIDVVAAPGEAGDTFASDFNLNSGGESINGIPGTITYNFTPAVAAVPEPSTWAMGLIGFGLLGLLGYRKTRGALA
jgi:hypothetical protein